ncbi:MAG TPA: hypothetical protein VF796_30370, partial [Humisphaera sp.]
MATIGLPSIVSAAPARPTTGPARPATAPARPAAALPPPATAPAGTDGFVAGLKAGDKVEAAPERSRLWARATVLRPLTDGRVLVQFEPGHPAGDTGWVSPGRVRPVSGLPAGRFGTVLDRANPPPPGADDGQAQRPVRPTTRTARSTTGPAAGAGGGGFVAIRTAEVPSQVAWAVKADPLAPLPAVPRAVRMPPTTRPAHGLGGEQPVRILFADPPAAQALVVLHATAVGERRETGRVVRVGLAAGSAEPPVVLPEGREVVSVSPDGQFGLAKVRERTAERMWETDDGRAVDVLDVLRLTAGNATLQTSFRPYPNDRVVWAAFVDARHVLTLGTKGTLVLWDLPPASPPAPVYRLAAGVRMLPALSPTRARVVVEH